MIVFVVFLCCGFVGGVFFLKECENLVSVFIREFCFGYELMFNVMLFCGDVIVLFVRLLDIFFMFFVLRILLFEFFFLILRGLNFLLFLFIFGVKMFFFDLCLLSCFGLISLFNLSGFGEFGIVDLVL